ncbi:hypothetical protein OIDMADRAFT_17466 [Oidiodendron maius Zn]|uniref:Uncharacterized protein n=1 Tax=Oidiodendron maius (strain Zn) TaxID=913774 RepID=A0A0C3HMW3_OIDMZ|nr:hypothetical protein OIDMADRAFT_17466 [Oidiodendron maius Zn]
MARQKGLPRRKLKLGRLHYWKKHLRVPGPLTPTVRKKIAASISPACNRPRESIGIIRCCHEMLTLLPSLPLPLPLILPN